MGRNKTPNAIDTGNYIPRTLSKKQTADYLGISATCFDTWIAEGFPLTTHKINAFDTGRYRLIDVQRALGEIEADETELIYQENRLRLKEVMRV